MFNKFLIIISLLIGGFLAAAPARAADQLTVYLFWNIGCPHCTAEKEFFQTLLADEPYASRVVLKQYEISENRDNLAFLKRTAAKLNFSVRYIPITVIGENHVVGFDSEVGIGALLKAEIDRHLATNDFSDPLASLVSAPKPATPLDNVASRIKLPWGQEVNLRSLSLPALTALLGLLDGFNPCAMWTLLFLISLLLGMKDRRRMWLLGSTFIVASAAVYFMFMAAWLNLILFLGFIVILRVIIGLVAVGGGAWSIRKFFKDKDSGCEVVASDKRQQIFTRIKQVIFKEKFYWALLGIALLAATVNLVELVCSAGFPAIFTQILALNDLAAWQRYAYILFYLVFYMLDDLLIFFLAMFTLRSQAFSTKYGRWTGLIGGILLFVVGILLIFKHEWLMFG